MGKKGQAGIRLTSFWAGTRGSLRGQRASSQCPDLSWGGAPPNTQMYHVLVAIWFHSIGRNNVRMDSKKQGVFSFVSIQPLTTRRKPPLTTTDPWAQGKVVFRTLFFKSLEEKQVSGNLI